ncbi:hypothetical protein STRPO_0620 [Streptococcus porcinus str. Jelinkova 176]|uniref:Uncharacterized protein n=1 Tax=Streptococcus porcinus str. Jelinkova 176 TaxID=873448 RepID=A0ABN0CVU4_STRPO|nr:hypothetical protein STRPO_0620 [Streptococcus porcinus str. Jelinkova 176]
MYGNQPHYRSTPKKNKEYNKYDKKKSKAMKKYSDNHSLFNGKSYCQTFQHP